MTSPLIEALRFGDGAPGKGAVHGKSYGEMTPAEFNAEAGRRSNAGFIERNAGPFAAGIGFPGPLGFAVGRGMTALDNSMFQGEQAQRAQAFTGAGQMMPDEFMGQQFGGGSGAPAMGVGATGDGFNGPASPGLDISADMTGGGLGGDRGIGYATGLARGPVQPQDLRGPNPPGPDQGYIPVMAGEVVMNQPQQQMLMQALRGRR